MTRLLNLSELKDLEVTVCFEGDLNNRKKMSYDDARLLCNLQDDFGKQIEPENSEQKEQYDKLMRMNLLVKRREAYELCGIAQRAVYIIE